MTNEEIIEAIKGAKKESLERTLKFLKTPKYREIFIQELEKKKGGKKNVKMLIYLMLGFILLILLEVMNDSE